MLRYMLYHLPIVVSRAHEKAYPQLPMSLQYAAVNSLGTCVAVAGRTGLAHYALFTRRWKLFGNETQVDFAFFNLEEY